MAVWVDLGVAPDLLHASGKSRRSHRRHVIDFGQSGNGGFPHFRVTDGRRSMLFSTNSAYAHVI